MRRLPALAYLNLAAALLCACSAQDRATLKGIEAAVAPPRVPVWEVRHSRSPMDDSPTVMLSLEAQEKIRGWLTEQIPTLIIRCKERRTDAYVVTGMQADVEYGGGDGHTVRLRFDERAAMRQAWRDSTDNEALFAPSPITFARTAARSQRLRFGFTPFNASPVVIEFNLTGLADHLPEVAKTCGWEVAANAAPSYPQHATGWVERVIDGDTFVLNSGERIRIVEIDAPELKEPGGDAARNFLLARIDGTVVRLERRGKDRYGRTLARVFLVKDGSSVGQALLDAGHAKPYP